MMQLRGDLLGDRLFCLHFHFIIHSTGATVEVSVLKHLTRRRSALITILNSNHQQLQSFAIWVKRNLVLFWGVSNFSSLLDSISVCLCLAQKSFQRLSTPSYLMGVGVKDHLWPLSKLYGQHWTVTISLILPKNHISENIILLSQVGLLINGFQ